MCASFEQCPIFPSAQKPGQPIGSGRYGQFFAQAIKAARLPDDCVLHGLRKTAARRLAEAGCTTEEIKAITGQSDRMVAHYTKDANQRKLATAAIVKLEKNAK